MANQKYYKDIKAFPSQFQKGIDLAKNIKLSGSFDRVIVCGMGGSAFYAELINDYLKSKRINFTLEANRNYNIPHNVNEKTLFVIASYSGNTEETLEALAQIQSKGYSHILLTSGGRLLDIANATKVPVLEVPTGIQPRLSSGYFISGLIKILSNLGFIEELDNEIISIAGRIDTSLNEESAKKLAKRLKNKVPIIYATEENWSIAKIAKIKFNENSKIQAFFNVFPELNHNEMVGFTNLIMNPLFIILQSKFTHSRNLRRIKMFTKLMKAPVEIIEMRGESIFEEIVTTYYFIDHVTYYLANEYNIDPEPVAMVEDFKKMLA